MPDGSSGLSIPMNGSDRPVRVLLIGPLPPPFGGPEVMTQTLLAGLKGRRDVAVRHMNSQVSESLADKGGRRQLRKSFTALAQALRMIAAIASFRPEIVYLPLTNSPSFAGFLRDVLFIVPALVLGRRVVVRLHGGYYAYGHTEGWRRRLVEAVFRRLSLVMVQGDRLRRVFDGFVPPERVVMIPNGIDGEPYRLARASRQASQSVEARQRVRVLFVGLLCAEKGVNEVLQAIPDVPAAEFLFLGEWPSADDARRAGEFLESRGVRERVQFAGVLHGAAKYEAFASSDIFVFPSYFVYEGHTVSSVEALAARLPIVCTDHGALGESVRDGWNGFFVPPHDAAAVAARLNQLVSDRALRLEMAGRSYQLFVNRFTIDMFVDNWVGAVRRAGTAQVGVAGR